MKRIIMVLFLVPFLALACSTTKTANEEGKNYNPGEKSESIRNAESTLRDYLRARSMGKYEECLQFLGRDFLNRFEKNFETDYVDYYRNQNEDYYKNFKILSREQLGSGVLMKVTVDVEGPGYKSEAVEYYHMIQERGIWKIDDWRIEYRE